MTSADSVLRALLDGGQVTAADLLRAAAAGRGLPAPTHQEFREAVDRVCPAASLRTYSTTFRRLSEAFTDVPVDAVSGTQLEELMLSIVEAALARGHTDGTGAARGFIHGARFFYKQAVKHGFRADNPAAVLELPQRRRRVRRALTEHELQEVYTSVASHGRDPELDLLLLDFHRETAARRGGAIALRVCDLVPERGAVLLREKGGHEREVPCSANLLRRIREHFGARGPAGATSSVFRYRGGAPLTRRRYNSIFERVQADLPWARRLGVSIHWLRHTTLTDISNAAGVRIAAHYAGHTDRSVTDGYTVPCFEDLVRAHRLVFPDLRTESDSGVAPAVGRPGAPGKTDGGLACRG